MPTTRTELEPRGCGFVPFAELPTSDVPNVAGVYAVVRISTFPPVFLPTSTGGHFKGRQPSVPVGLLRDAWVPDVQTLYLGKADVGRTGCRGIRTRLDEYRRYGQGQPIGHQGGRYIWQLADAAHLLVAWLPTPDDDPGEVEAKLIAEFKRAVGTRPFANRNVGRRCRRPSLTHAPGLPSTA